ncbi:ABC-three component system middle component 6 [Clostridium minihomine]|uniref:ABC-three component system middle component 6 n=1 Tax=Clostridium minihomine TaxID=2045012 RepID=UPI000C755F63|nr:ABC-three component system middle component 6 [Clostridium minihomine]
MLLPDNIHPELSIYYNGALVLNELKKKDNQPIINLYQIIKGANNMSFPTFILCLDWLYLIEVAQINERGNVELCS